jgi:hypothetical protein
MKYDQGLFEKAGKMDPKNTTAVARSREVIDLSREAAHKALLVVRDEKKLLPLSKDKKILVVEQLIPYPFLGKDLYSHPHMFCEAMAKHSLNLVLDDAGFHAAEEDVEEALQLAKGTDLVVVTNYYARIEKRGNNQHLVKALKKAGHTVVVVTNYPYIEGTTRDADAVVCNFSGSPDSIRLAADLLFGAIQPYSSTRMPIVLPKETDLPPQKPSAAKKPPAKKASAKKPAKRKGFAYGGKC